MTFVRVILVIRLQYKYRKDWCLAFGIGILIFWVDTNLWIKQHNASNCTVPRCDIENSIDNLNTSSCTFIQKQSQTQKI